MPTTFYSFMGFLIAAVGVVFTTLKSVRLFLTSQEEIAKAKYNAEIAKQKAELLTASQVMELMKATNELKKEVTQIKVDNEDRDEQLSEAIEKLEANFNRYETTLQQFLLARLNQFEQTLIK